MTVARMAAVMGVSPEALLDLDLPLFNETARQVQIRQDEWRREDEMRAVTIEMLHAVHSVIVAANSSKRQRIQPFHFPRPYDTDDGPKTVSNRQMFALLGGAA